MEDIRQTGPVGLKGLKGLNRQQNKEQIPTGNDLLSKLKRTRLQGTSPENASLEFSRPAIEDTGLQAMNLGYGQSRYDEGVTESQMQNLSDVRGQEQPWYWQLTNAIGKGAIQAATTFVDGTAGLLLGVGEAIGYGLNGYNASSSLSRLFHNEISDSINQLNQYMEEVLPNYRTDEEQNNEWYQNLGTMNFWADSILKNIGFTVGSIYSGNAWNMALKGVGMLKNASTFGAKITGSLLSSINEGRQEANQNSTDMLNLNKQQIMDARNKRYQEIDNLYKQRYKEIMNSEMSDNQKQANLALLNQDIQNRRTQINNSTNALLKDAVDRANQAGLLDLAINIPILTYTDYKTYGKIFANSFKGARQQAKKEGISVLEQARRNANKAILQEEDEIANRIVKRDDKYVWNKITAKGNWLNAGKIALREGNEEMSQQMAANLSGEYFQPDSPDAYYKAMRNHKSNVDTQDLISSIVKGFNSSYGDKAQWEQFVAGAINGLIGVPTFGKAANSSANTYLGRNKWIGLSGGVFGERAMGKQYNEQGSPIVDRMNKLLTDIQDKKKLIAQSNSFINAMNGYNEAENKFEYENANDNDTFNLYTAYLQAGKEDDLKEILNQQFENFSDEQLNEIKDFNDFKKDEWLDKDGNLTEDGKEAMRNKLIERRDDLLKQFDKYKNALSIIKNTSIIPKEHQNEMAWLYWKSKRFKDRINSILDKKENVESLRSFLDGINQYANDLRNEQTALKGDETREEKYIETDEKGNEVERTRKVNILDENKKIVENLDSISSLITKLMNKDQGAIATLSSKENEEIINRITSQEYYDMFKDHSDMDYMKYKNVMDSLKDSYKLASAIKQFNEKFEEYIKNPNKINEDHKHIDDEEEKNETLHNNTQKRDRMNSQSVSDIVNQDDTEFEENINWLNNIKDEDLVPTDLSNKQKYKEAKQIKDTFNKAIEKLNKQLANGEITQNQYDIQKAALENSKKLSESKDELLDLDLEAFQDTNQIDENDFNNFLQEQAKKQHKKEDEFTEDELQQLADIYKQKQIDEAKSNLEGIKRDLAEEAKNDEKVLDLSNPNPTIDETRSATDPTSTTPSTQEQAKRQTKETTNKKNINKIINDLSNSILVANHIEPTDTNKQLVIQGLNLIYAYTKQQVNDSIYHQGVQSYLGKAMIALKNTNIYKELQSIINNPYKVFVDTYPMLLSIAQVEIELNELEKWLEWENNHITLEEKKADKKNYDLWKKWRETHKSLSNVNDKGVTIFDNKIGNETEEQKNEDLTVQNNDNEILTPEITEKELDDTISKPYVSIDNTQTFNFLYPTTTEYNRFTQINARPYHESVKDTELQKRYKTLHDFMLQHDAFNHANNLKVNSVIHFGFSRSLNDSLGKEMVILMFDENDNIVGDLPTIKDQNSGKIKGLQELMKRAFDTLYKYQGTEDIVIFDNIESHVSKMMIGKPKFENERLSLNTIFENVEEDNNGNKFLLAITNENKANELQTNGATNKKIIKPLTLKNGQPYVLIQTVNDEYYPVPFIMQKFNLIKNKNILNTSLGKEVFEVLKTITSIKSDKDCIVFKNKLQKLLVLSSCHVNIKDNKLIISIQRQSDKHPFTILSTDINTLTTENTNAIALKVAQNLSGQGGTSFQIDINKINTIDDGISYNQKIGELAETNLQKGATHTINDWFTVNPIENSKEIKGERPTTLGVNPNQRKPVLSQTQQPSTLIDENSNFSNKDLFVYKNGDITYEFNTKTNNVIVYDKNGNIIKQKPSNERKAFLYIKAHNLKETVVKTPFGIFNTQTNKIIDEFECLEYLLENPFDFEESIINLIDNPKEKYETLINSLNSLTKNYLTDILNKNNITNKFKIIAIKDEKGNYKFQLQYKNYNRIDTLSNYFIENNNINNIAIISPDLIKYKDTIFRFLINRLITNEEEKEINNIFDSVLYKPYVSIDETDKDWMNKQNINNEQKQQTEKKHTIKEVIEKYAKNGVNIDTKINRLLSKIDNQELIDKLYDNIDNSNINDFVCLLRTFRINYRKETIESKINDFFDKPLNRLSIITTDKTAQSYKVWDREGEIGRITKILPQLSKDEVISIVDSIANLNGDATIYGQYKNGSIIIARNAAKGTLYHEAFHFVSQSLLTRVELNDVYSLARDKYGKLDNIELEENLAEDFRRYMEKEEGFKGVFVKFWRKLKNLINIIFNNTHTIDKLFFDISRGSYANRQIHESNKVLNRTSNDDLIKERIEKSNIIWGHPAIGKTYYINHSDDIIDWDNEINKEKNRFVAKRVRELNPNATQEELFNLQMKFLADANDEKYIEFLDKSWDKVIEKAKKENKKLFVSSLPVLKRHKNDFDLFINMSENEFVNRDVNRGHDKLRAIEWKKGIDSALQGIDSSKIVSTNNYLSDIMGLRSPEILEDSKQFLSNFGISLQDVSEYKGTMPLFDALNRVINFKNVNELTEGVGEAIAFMMQHNDKIQQLMYYKYVEPKAIRRSLRKRGDFDINLTSLQKKTIDKNKNKLLKEIGSDIATELRKIYNLEDEEKTENRSFVSYLKDIILEFLDKLTTPVRIKFNTLFNYSIKLARAVYDNDKSVIVSNNIKPGTKQEGQLVNIEKAFKENPYEENITSKLNKYNIALAGSASIALAGTLYRPAENPLHDLDFNAGNKTQSEIEDILKEEFGNCVQTQYIATPNAPSVTYSYLIMDRPFKVKRISEGIGKFKDIIDANTGELIGRKIGSDLILEKGIKGKLLDFFVDANGHKSFDTFTVTLNNKNYLITSEKNSFRAKIDWQREKDIFDFNRFIPNKDIDRNKIIQYYRNKNMILNDEQIQYLNDRNISIDDYSKMSDEEKETLWKCM